MQSMENRGQNPTGSEGTSSTPVSEMGNMLAQILQTMQQGQTDQHTQLLLALQNQVGGNPGGDAFARRIKDFSALGGMKFSGNRDYLEAKQWIRECESIFNRMTLTEVQKQEVASHQLTGSALQWWQTIEGELDLPNFTWVAFKGKFVEQFIPAAVQTQMMEQFLHLKQGNLTVQQYVRKFNELSYFAPYMIDTPQKKNSKFVRGLNYNISRGVIPVQSQSFEVVMNTAISMEDNENQHTRVRKDVGQSSHSGNRFQNRGNDRSRPYGHGVAPPRQGNPGFDNPQRDHVRDRQHRPVPFPAPYVVAAAPAGDFWGSCWECNQAGHRSSQCPNRGPAGRGAPVVQGGPRGGRGGVARGGRGQPQRPAPAVQPAPGRVFAAQGAEQHEEGIYFFQHL